MESTGDICVYIDGSCINNGKITAKAGYGVFFDYNDSRNEYGNIEGKQSNNTGELTALIRALEILKTEISEKKIIDIYTDSEYVIKCSGSYGSKLAKNNWKTQQDKVPPNLKLLQKIYELYNPNKKTINIYYIKAHTDLTDKHSIGNREADKLANMAVNGSLSEDTEISKYKKPRDDITKNYINVSYVYKDNVKKLGAKWDMNNKKWYYEDNLNEDNIKSIKEFEVLSSVEKETVKEKAAKSESREENTLDNSKVYIKIPFKNKDNVKKLGCKWDPEKKSWYYMSNTDKNKIGEIMKLA
jgi:ribonuclease HI